MKKKMRPERQSYNRVEIDLAALRQNYLGLRNLVGPGVRLMAVVKSEAYGHGLVEVAAALARAGATTFGVADVEEGARLRQAGIAGEIVVLLGGRTGSPADLLENTLTPVVYDREYLLELAGEARRIGRVVPVQLKVDTGMARLGIMPEKLPEFLKLLHDLPELRLSGLLSHFPLADSIDQEPTVGQNRRFTELAALAVREGINPTRHIANSAALLRQPVTHHGLVRPGITLYGCYPVSDQALRASLRLQPVMSFKTNVLQVKEVPAGSGISYGQLFTTTRPTRLAVLPVGYDDGYLRRLTGRAQVLLGGRRAKVVGRICMNVCMVDITELPEVKPGDEVVIMGRQGDEEITADELAVWQETINYEVLCLIGGRNQHCYLPDRAENS
jgi:alanine racemase